MSIGVHATTKQLLHKSEHSEGVLEIIEVLEKRHYRDVDQNDHFATLFFERYVELLDPGKNYFYADDLARFKTFVQSLDESLSKGDLDDVFLIYNTYQERFEQRMEANISLLESNWNFNFEIDENLSIDVDNRQWFNDKETADDYWRKRIKDSMLRLLLADKEEKAAKELLIKRYKNQLSLISKQSADDVYELLANALSSIYDPHTSYLSPRALKNFQISMSLSLEGIGAVLQREDELTKIVRIVPGGPADKNGNLSPGDKIVGVAEGKKGENVDVIGWRLDNVVELIRGKKGTLVRLSVIKGKGQLGDQLEEISIVRDEVKLESQAATSEIITIQNDDAQDDEKQTRLGVITLPAFYMDFDAYREGDKNYKSTTRDVYKLLSEFREENVDGIIIDLRNNGGGSLHEATALTDLFIDPGPVVQIKHANGRISREQVALQQAMYSGPLLVLINRLSASASEIFAGAIQDYGRGLVVGSQSFGKGTVQVLTPLDRGQLKFTSSKFYRISGESTQHRGVLPDINFPSLFNPEDIGESTRDYALPWDRINPVPHRYYSGVVRFLPELQDRHQTRISGDLPWNLMLEELALINENKDRTQLSLNRRERIELKNERENILMILENKRREATGEKAYETIEAWRVANEEENQELSDEEDTDTPFDPFDDPQLKESGYILHDYISLVRSSGLEGQLAAH